MNELASARKYQAWENFIKTRKIDPQVVRKEIARSWERCLLRYGLDPYAPKRPICLSKEEIIERYQKNTIWIRSAKPFLQVLESAVTTSGFIVTLADKDGYVLELFGDGEILERARANNYLPGCRRTEDEVGTNSIGLSLCERKPVQVTGCEHFNVNHHCWSCSSSPIFSPEGELLGTINLSGKCIEKHQHTLGMVICVAKGIENMIREVQLLREKSSLNSYLDSLLDSISEGIIAINKYGKVTHINRIAEKMLDVSKEAVISRVLNGAIDIDLKAWEEIMGNSPLCDQEMSMNISGKRKFFIISTKPVEVDLTNLGKILILTERQRVCELLQRFIGNHTRFTFDDIIGKDPQLLQQIELAKIVSRTDSRVLLVGESGTGKEMFVQAIHNQSKRSNEPFVAVNCAAVPRELIETELFGYKEGAFTGSRKGGQIGKFELANKGTLFLDEISSMPLEMQAKILRVLEDSEVVRLGDNQVRKVDVRIIAATNKDLSEEVRNMNFRKDLYFRLNVVEILIPSLRERLEDLPLLSEHILKTVAMRLGTDTMRISKESYYLMGAYHWPGNVRELENYLERASIVCENGLITPEDFPSCLYTSLTPPENHENVKTLKEEENTCILKALRECKGNVSQSARKLQISRSTIHRRIRARKLSFQ